MSWAEVAGFVALALVCAMIWAGMHDGVVKTVVAAFDLAARPLVAIIVALRRVVASLNGSEDGNRDALAYRTHDQNQPGRAAADGSRSNWDLIGPVVYFVFFVVEAATDAAISLLKFGPLLGLRIKPPSYLQGGTLTVVSGLMLTLCITIWGFVAFDVAGLSPLRRPFDDRPWLQRLAIVGFCASLVTGPLFFVWGQYQISGHPLPALAFLFVGILGFLLLGALLLSGWATFPVILVGIVVLTMLGRWLVSASISALTVVLSALDAATEWICSLVSLSALIGRGLWNWIVKIAPERWKLGLIDEPGERPQLKALTELDAAPTEQAGPDRGVQLPDRPNGQRDPTSAPA